MTKSQDKPGQVTRREFFGAIFGLSLVAMMAQFGSVLARFLEPVIEEGAFGTVVRAGRVEEFEVGSVNYFRQARFYLVRLEDGFLAEYRKCTHLGCVVPWIEEEGIFNCPCHSSLFTKEGEVISGPAPRPLDLFPIEIRDGVIYVDTGTIIEREAFHPDQLTPA
ncbi:MAG: ubiquinol-cytochrome c reductase iron-sulfur subunit [Chloroflexi bacterium]|nr:ubiquinol-cytochrome c reductase iron-sulfur subunit [Chloroflexota bacterium]